MGNLLPLLSLLSTLLPLISAIPAPAPPGICLSTIDSADLGSMSQITWVVFPAGSGCDSTAISTLTQRSNEDLCSIMACKPSFSVTGASGTFTDVGPEVQHHGCGATMVINEKNYNGRVLNDAEAKSSGCSVTCTDSMGTKVVLGVKIFENLAGSPQAQVLDQGMGIALGPDTTGDAMDYSSLDWENMS